MCRPAYLSLAAALWCAAVVWLLAPQPKVQAALVSPRTTVYIPAVVVGSPLLDAREVEAFTLINQERRAVGCPPVALDQALSAAAETHSQDMADHNYFSHVGLNGSTFAQRAYAASYGYNPSGEIIAAGYADAQSTVKGWLGSRTHRDIIHTCSNQHIGVGVVSAPGSQWGHYWTVLFGYR